MEKIEYKKLYKEYYSVRRNKIEIVDVPGFDYLAIDGVGNPNTSQEFKDAVEALYALSYSIKFMVKKSEMAVDYGVMPLEGQWYMDDMSQFTVENKDNWKWTIMIMQPEVVTKSIIDKAIKDVKVKKKLPALDKIRFEEFTDGLSAQIMHIGPYSEEQPTIDKLHEHIKDNGFKLTGKHREIYLSDVNKTDPEKLRTVIRQPIERL